MFKRTDRVTSSGCLLTVLDVSVGALTRAFGAPCRGHEDDEAGYSGEEWYFEGTGGQKGHFHVYVRCGQPRIGGNENQNLPLFKAWLRSRL
jgi:hypothetical protein